MDRHELQTKGPLTRLKLPQAQGLACGVDVAPASGVGCSSSGGAGESTSVAKLRLGSGGTCGSGGAFEIGLFVTLDFLFPGGDFGPPPEICGVTGEASSSALASGERGLG